MPSSWPPAMRHAIPSPERVRLAMASPRSRKHTRRRVEVSDRHAGTPSFQHALPIRPSASPSPLWLPADQLQRQDKAKRAGWLRPRQEELALASWCWLPDLGVAGIRLGLRVVGRPRLGPRNEKRRGQTDGDRKAPHEPSNRPPERRVRPVAGRKVLTMVA